MLFTASISPAAVSPVSASPVDVPDLEADKAVAPASRDASVEMAETPIEEEDEACVMASPFSSSRGSLVSSVSRVAFE